MARGSLKFFLCISPLIWRGYTVMMELGWLCVLFISTSRERRLHIGVDTC